MSGQLLPLPLISGRTERVPFFYLILGLMVLMILLAGRLERSRIGDYFCAIREDEDASEALGINTTRYKLLAMAISSLVMALGGSFYAQYMSYIQPDIVLGIGLSIEIIFGPIIGGMGTVWGPLVGASLLAVFSEISRVTMGQYRGMHLMVYGVFIILIMLYLPEGILKSLARRRKTPGEERGKE